jgi:hypothetical protein
MSDTFGEDAFEELMEEEFFDEELEVSPWAEGPRSQAPRRSQPKACPTLYNDCATLTLGVVNLVIEMAEKHLNLERIANLTDLVIDMSRKIIAGLRKRAYVKAGCSHHDLSEAAKIVHNLAGQIPDMPGPERRHNPYIEKVAMAKEWLRRAEGAFPRIK